MRIVQISRTESSTCGIGLFAEKLQSAMRGVEVEMATAPDLPSAPGCDAVMLHYHEDLFTDVEVVALAGASPAPFFLFAHSPAAAGLCKQSDGLIAMCAAMFGPTRTPIHLFPHPAWIPSRLEERGALRREFGLPEERRIAGTSGFLRFERRFAEIVEALLPAARRHDWFLQVVSSPWRLDSPGLIPRLMSLQRANPEHFRFAHAFLAAPTLNRRLQACDLLWCWTDAPSSAYASGAISDQYASGTRVYAADKQQHRHVLGLPNVVMAQSCFEPFVDGLIAELHRIGAERHDPVPVGWRPAVEGLATFLHTVAREASG